MSSVDTSVRDRMDVETDGALLTGHAAVGVDALLIEPKLAIRPEVMDINRQFVALVALDEDSVTRAVVRTTAALARTRGAIPTVLRVIELNKYLTAESLPEITMAEELILASDASHEFRDRLLDLASGLAGYRLNWCANLAVGDDVRCIIKAARTTGAELIVMGLEHHGSLRRAFVGDTVHRVMTDGSLPVLAVTKSLEALPARIVVGMDFTASSVKAMEWAARILAPNGLIDLVHVTAEANHPGADERRDTESNFARVIAQLALSTSVRVTTTCLDGSAADALSRHADATKADLIALGSHRRRILDRIRLGSVSTDIVHFARCSVLVAPPELT